MNTPADDGGPLAAALQAPGWDPARVAAALAVVVPNDQRIAQAALQRLTLDDHAATHAAWCDAWAVPPDV